jgi:putative oxidoreductase
MASNVAYMKAYGLPAADLLIWPAALFEIVAGAMLAAGWKTRWAALALVAYTGIAMLIFHAYWNVPADQALNQQIHFMKNVAIIGGLLLVFAHGPARFSIERSLQQARPNFSPVRTNGLHSPYRSNSPSST